MGKRSKAKKEPGSNHMDIFLGCFSVSMKHRTAVTKSAEEHGLQKGQHRLLFALAHMGESVCQRDLAERARLTPSAIAINLKKLEKMGAVEKKISETDNRYNMISLTPKGEKIVKESEEIFRKIDEMAFQGFSEAEVKQLRDLLARVEKNMESIHFDERKEKDT